MGVKMKTNLSAVVLMAFLCSFVTSSLAQKKDPVEELDNRVKILEGQKENLDKQAELLQEKFEAKAKEVDTQFQAEVTKLNLTIDEIKTDQRNNNWIFIALLAIICFIGVGGFWGIKKHINKKVQEFAEKMIKDLLEKKEKELLEIAEKQSEEFQLKEKKSILIIRQNPKEDPFMEKFFRYMGFRNVQYEPLNQVKDPNKYDLLLFDNEKQNIPHPDILNIMAKTRADAFCFYFGPDRFDGKEFKDRVNFANSRVQLYGNLINSLRYQTLLKP